MELCKIVRGKKILFICPIFQHYHNLICKEFKDNGADIVFIPTYKEPLIERLLRKNKQTQLTKYYQGFHDLLHNKKFDFVFIIKGDDYTETLMSKYFGYKCSKILYQWDSLKNWNYIRLISLFDRVYSFDPIDCSIDRRLIYTPNFYIEKMCTTSSIKYDIVTVAGYATWRYGHIDQFLNFSKTNSISTFFRLYLPFRAFLRFVLQGKVLRLELISFFRIKQVEYDRIFTSASAVLDVSSPDQAGLSLRVIEAIAAQKKVITTNRNIIRENFYTPDTILILEEGTLNESSKVVDFLKCEKPLFPDISHLKLNNWLFKVLK